MVDMERLDRALARIEAHPEAHDQRVWVRDAPCGTAACLAGHVVMAEHPDGRPSILASYIRDGRRAYHFWALPDGPDLPVASTARWLLGLDMDQADVLFAASNRLDDLKRMRDLLADDPVTPWWRLEGLEQDPDGEGAIA